MTDSDYERVPVSDWDALTDNLRRFAAGGEFDATDDELSVRVGSARFSVARDGRVETGMPLHDFADTADALGFDHERGRIRVADDDREYVFRRP